MHPFLDSSLDGYCSTVQGLLDWFEVDLGFTELSFIQIGLCVLCDFVLYSRVSLSSCPFLDILHCLPRAVIIIQCILFICLILLEATENWRAFF